MRESEDLPTQSSPPVAPALARLGPSGRTVSASSSGVPRTRPSPSSSVRSTTVRSPTAGQRAQTATQDAQDRNLNAQITADETKEAVQELRTAVADPLAAQGAPTTA
ncbi:hypothetical protein E4U37_000638 [Claviceps purpurea]|nr:hypothetical protein E4U37_000638 [Claviceps purpurea]